MQYPTKVGNKYEMKKSDHLTIIVKLKDLSKKNSLEPKSKKECQWNYNKVGGWDVYKHLTEDFTQRYTNHSKDVNEIDRKIERKLVKVKHKAFGKCSRKRTNISTKVSELMKQKNESKSTKEKEEFDEEIGRELMKEKFANVEREVNRIKEDNNSHQMQVLKVRKLITNNADKKQIEAIIDPESNELLYNPKDILRATLKYSSCTLQNNPSEDEFVEYFEEMRKAHESRIMKGNNDDDDSLTEEEFDREINALRKNNMNYKEIINAGDGLRREVFEFFKLIWRSEEIPASWDLTTLKQIYKRGNKQSLESYRYVHLKQWRARLFDGLVFSRMKKMLINGMSKFQIGGKPGHRIQEHLFVFHSVLELYKKTDTCLFIQAWDISRYFDRHHLSEAMTWLAEASVPDKCYRLFWHLNKNTVVKVKTAAGESDTAVTGENLGQGSKSASTVCSMSLSKSVSVYYEDSEHEVSYGVVKLAPMQYIDDALRVTTSLEGARDGCRRFEAIMASKGLTINIDKSIYLLAGKRKNVDKIRAELSRHPLLYKGSILKEKTTEKWLGSQINPLGLKESTLSTLNERKARILNIIHESIAIIEDCRMHKLGALKSLKEIWELVICPALLTNAEMFYIGDPKIEKCLEDFQSTIYRGALALPKSCPLPALAYESNSLLMKYRVYSRILNFMKHIYMQDIENNLSKQILNEQLSQNWPGQSQVAIELCEQLGIYGLFDSEISKAQFKAIVKKACQDRNEEELNNLISIYKKMAALRDEVQKGNSYFFTESLQNARTIFRFRVELFEAKLNFRNKQEYKSQGNYLCDSCESESDDNTHVLFCPSYAPIRENKNLNCDTDLANYLQKVLEIRTNLRLNR